MKIQKKQIIRSLATVMLAASFGNAAILYDSGDTSFTATGTQFGRISRDGIPSDWSGPKDFPGVTGAPTALGYLLVTVNSGAFPYLQINFDNPAATLFVAAYGNSYAPVNSSPNYGLDVNYLGDAGSSQPFDNPSFFQIVVAPNSDILFVINELSPGGGAEALFHLIVEGFYDTDYNDVPEIPEPASVVSMGIGLALFGALGWKKRSSR